MYNYTPTYMQFGYKAIKFEKIFHLKFDAIQISNFLASSEYPNFKKGFELACLVADSFVM